jgi:hypothetical protein
VGGNGMTRQRVDKKDLLIREFLYGLQNEFLDLYRQPLITKNGFITDKGMRVIKAIETECFINIKKGST